MGKKKCKIFVSMLLSMTMLFTALPVFAAEYEDPEEVVNETDDIPEVDQTGGGVIDDWDYTLGQEYTNDEGIIYLHHYKGSDTNVSVPATMQVDGNAYPVRQTVIKRVTGYNSIFPDTVESVSFESGVRAGDDISNMFSGCDKLTSVDLTGFNTAGAANISGMFKNCSSLESIDVSPMDVSGAAAVANHDRGSFTESIFYGCSSLKSIDLSSWTFNAYGNLKLMFYDCTSLETVKFCNILAPEFSSKGSTGRNSDMQSMFCNCQSLKSIEFPAGLNMDNCTNLSNAFYGCTSLQEIDMSNWYFSKPDMEDIPNRFYLDLTSMFQNCSSLTEIKMPNIYRAVALNYTFSGCDRLVTADLSQMDMSMQQFLNDDDSDLAYQTFEGALKLRTINSPVNVLRKMSLPAAFTGSDGVRYTEFPKNKTDSITLTLDSSSIIPLESINFGDDGSEISIDSVGGERIVNMRFAPETATYKTADLTISDPSVISIEKINEYAFSVFALKTGTATITATATDGSGVSASLKVYVFGQGGAVTEISLDKPEVTVGVGKTVTVKASCIPADAVDQRLEWTIRTDDDEFISITVSEDTHSCTIKGLKTTNGEQAMISVSTLQSSGYAYKWCRVNVTKSGGSDIPQPDPIPATTVTLVKGQKYDASSLLAGFLSNKKNKLSVSNTKVASITAKGLITAKGYADVAEILCNGNATGLSVRTEVPKITEKTVTLNNLNQTYNSKDNISGFYYTTPRWEFASSKNPIATIDSSTGLITPIKAGSAKVNAVFDNVGTKGSVSFPFTIKVIVPQLSKTCVTINSGGSAKVTLKNVKSGSQVNWSSLSCPFWTATTSGKNNEIFSIKGVKDKCGLSIITASVDGMYFYLVIGVTNPAYKEYNVETAGSTVWGYYDYKASAQFVDLILKYRKDNGLRPIGNLSDLTKGSNIRVREMTFPTGTNSRPDGTERSTAYTDPGLVVINESLDLKTGKAAYDRLVKSQEEILLRSDITKMGVAFFKAKTPSEFYVKTNNKVVRKKFNYFFAEAFGK
ncbi:MAG: leucine-rich repeat protein [Lachnospiraceae bacterium]|nr:leucine-rich repeat protein [Lachnospiraceae bacterium]